MHKYLRFFIVSCTLSMMALTLLFTPVTSAAPGNGAEPYNLSGCYTDSGSTYCYAEKGVFNYTTTPSGNVTFTGNGRSSLSVTDPSGVVIYSASNKYHYQGLDKDEVQHEFGTHSTFTYSYGGMTCTEYVAFHVVDNHVQFNRYNQMCVGV